MSAQIPEDGWDKRIRRLGSNDIDHEILACRNAMKSDDEVIVDLEAQNMALVEALNQLLDVAQNFPALEYECDVARDALKLSDAVDAKAIDVNWVLEQLDRLEADFTKRAEDGTHSDVSTERMFGAISFMQTFRESIKARIGESNNERKK